ncbi:MAG: glycosyltransferase family 4 protein [Candidatus Omnitrophota bacterium]
MKKLLLISFEYPTGKSYCGGVGQVVEQSRNALLELGHEAYVLISSDFDKRRGVKLLLPDNSLKRYRSLGAFLKDYDWTGFTHIIHHFVNWSGELKKIKGRRGRRPRIIYHFHSILRREKDSGFRTLNSFLYNQEKMIALADRIICPSAYEYDNFTRYFPSFINKVAVVENTFEGFPLNREIVKQVRAEYGIGDNDVVSLYVGRLERIKGAHLLLQEAPVILKRYRNAKLFFVGKWLEQDLYKKLRGLCKRFPRQLFYKRYLERERLFQYYYLSDIYINTSLSESFSLSTHEGAFCNNALLLSRLPVLEKFRDAALFFEAKESDFTHKYETLIRNKDLRERLSARASAVAVRFMDKERMKRELSLAISSACLRN